jgi:hypothetical protein
MGIGAAPSRKTRGRIVIFFGSDRFFRQEPRSRNEREASTVLLEVSPESIFFLFKIMLMLFATQY